MKRLTALIFAMLCLTGVYAQVPAGHTIWFDTPSTSDSDWETRSLPIGNGNIGANVFGNIATEYLTLNEKSLWLGGPNSKIGTKAYWDANKQSAAVLKEIRRAFLDKDFEKADYLTTENFNGNIPYDTVAFGGFTTLGDLRIETGLKPEGVSQYVRALSVDSAFTTVNFVADGIRYERRAFVSYPDNILVLRFTANAAGKQNLSLRYNPNTTATGTTVAEGKDGIVYRGTLNNNGMAFVVRIKAILRGGSLQNTNGTLVAKNADEVMFLLTADTDYKINYDPDYNDPKSFVGVDPDKTTAQWMKKAAKKDYNKLFATHLKDYKALYDRVALSLPKDKSANAATPTYARLENYRQGVSDFDLEETYFQYGRYLLIASSRPGNLPANLQGIWANGLDGPWHVDYHNNINIQMNYWPALTCNLAECQEPLTDFIEMQRKPGAVTAKKYFNARGWTTSISSNPFGFTAPLIDKTMSWNLNPVAGPWLATHLWEYYAFTRDRNFLKNTAYPILKEAADFCCDYLWQKPDGTLTAAPSTSPEHGTVDEGTTFTHAVIREVLGEAIEAANILSENTNDIATWSSNLAALAPYKIGRYGQLMEWSRDIDDPDDHHRHVNHLFGLHPGSSISPVLNPDLAEASRVVLEHRGDGATGWSMGWKLNQWARLQDGNHSYTLFQNLLKDGTADNLWDMHPPFQIDGNFGGTAGIAEMLLQSQSLCVQLLPALPDAWSEGSVKGLCARGGFTVDITWKDGKLSEATITSRDGQPCSVRYGEETLEFETSVGKTYKIINYNNYLKLQ